MFVLFLLCHVLKSQEIVDQRRLCLGILEKVKEVYNYEFLPHPELEHQLSMNNVYDLIKFLNYDYVDFFGDVWRYLKTDLKKTDVKQFCVKNSDKIIIVINEKSISLSINSEDKKNSAAIFKTPQSTIPNNYEIILRSNLLDKIDTKILQTLKFYDMIQNPKDRSLTVAECEIDDIKLNLVAYCKCNKVVR